MDGVKCRKCRFNLFNTSIIVDSHGSPKSSDDTKDLLQESILTENTTVVYITEDSSRWDEWIVEQINCNEWIKGRLFCPKCNFRLGSFDFVSGTLCKCGKMPLPPVHITKSKVDFHTQEERSEINELINNRPPNPAFNFPIMTLETSLPICSSEAETSPVKSELQEKSKWKQKSGEFKAGSTCTTKEKTEPKKSDPDLVILLTCSVCLDIFFSPFTCKPCGHVFCESCLRKVALPSPTCTLCPLCRCLIYSCEIHKDYNKIIRANFHSENAARQRNENRNLSKTSPLPWVPLHQFRNPELEQSILETIFNIPRNLFNAWTSIPTIGLLFFLHCVGLAIFFVTYFCFYYVGKWWVRWCSPLLMSWMFWASDERNDDNLGDKSRDNDLPAIHSAVFAFIITLFVWKKLKTVVPVQAP